LIFAVAKPFATVDVGIVVRVVRLTIVGKLSKPFRKLLLKKRKFL
jgi:hypothetical protein